MTKSGVCSPGSYSSTASIDKLDSVKHQEKFYMKAVTPCDFRR